MRQPEQRHPESPWFRVAMDIAMDMIVMMSSFDVMIGCSGGGLADDPGKDELEQPDSKSQKSCDELGVEELRSDSLIMFEAFSSHASPKVKHDHDVIHFHFCCYLRLFFYFPFGTGGRSTEISAFEGGGASNWVGEPHYWREAATGQANRSSEFGRGLFFP